MDSNGALLEKMYCNYKYRWATKEKDIEIQTFDHRWGGRVGRNLPGTSYNLDLALIHKKIVPDLDNRRIFLCSSSKHTFYF